MTNQGSGSERARQLLVFYAPEVVRLAVAWLDANPGGLAVGVMTPSDAPRPAGFVGATQGDIARGVVDKAAMVDFLEKHAPSAVARLQEAPAERQTHLLVFSVLDGSVSCSTFALPGSATGKPAE